MAGSLVRSYGLWVGEKKKLVKSYARLCTLHDVLTTTELQPTASVKKESPGLHRTVFDNRLPPNKAMRGYADYMASLRPQSCNRVLL